MNYYIQDIKWLLDYIDNSDLPNADEILQSIKDEYQ